MVALRAGALVSALCFCTSGLAQTSLAGQEDALVNALKVARKAVVSVADARALAASGAGKQRIAQVAKDLQGLISQERVLEMIRNRLNMDKDASSKVEPAPPKKAAEDAKRDRETLKDLGKAARDLVEEILANVPVNVLIQGELTRLMASSEERFDLNSVAKLGEIAGKLSEAEFENDAPKVGSGFSVGGGYIVTTADVLEGMQRPVVILENGDRVRAEVSGVDPILNIGLLKLSASVEIPSLSFSTRSAEQGRFVVTLSSQSGSANAASMAMVARIRERGTFAGDRFYPRLIQVSGPISPGASGSPLLDLEGKVLGMVAAVPETEGVSASNAPVPPKARAKFTSAPVPGAPALPTQGSFTFSRNGSNTSTERTEAIEVTGNSHQLIHVSVSNIGFAIPCDEMSPIVDELKSGKPIVRGWLGVYPGARVDRVEDGPISKEFQVVLCAGVYPNSPALKSGMLPGDEIVEINGKKLTCMADLRESSIRLRPGMTIPVVVRRNSQPIKLTLSIHARPAVVADSPIMRTPPGGVKPN